MAAFGFAVASFRNAAPEIVPRIVGLTFGSWAYSAGQQVLARIGLASPADYSKFFPASAVHHTVSISESYRPGQAFDFHR